ncbi:MAG: class I SAM-dependent methyltransferase [Nitrososphaerales archaeon]
MKDREVDLYNNAYSRFEDQVLQDVRKETYGKDLGQSGWMTVDEYLRFFRLLKLKENSRVLDIACGSGNPTLFMAKTTGSHVTGIDINANGIKAANKTARDTDLGSLARFKLANASKKLRFPDSTFDAVICIDAIIHLPNRLDVLKECKRVLKSGGRMLFTDPTVLTGLVSQEELAMRSSIGFYLFAPPGENERLIQRAGFRLVLHEDATRNMFKVSNSWQKARQAHKKQLLRIEGRKNFDGLQRFLLTVRELAKERRLSRYLFVAQKGMS